MGRTNLIKEKNLNILRKIMRKEKTATKARLAQLSALSVVTIQSLTNTLLENGEIAEAENVQAEVGRPAVSYRYNELYRLILVVFMYDEDGKDIAEYRVCNLYGECLESRSEVLSKVEKDSYFPVLDELIRMYPDIAVLYFGLPAVEDSEGTIISSDYKNLIGQQFVDAIKKRYGVPSFLDNDVNTAAYGHYCKHWSGKTHCTAVIYMPTKYPPGAGVCMNGEILRGRNGMAGEISMLPLGIDWDTFDYDYVKMNKYLVQTLQIFNAVYNPDNIVIYSQIAEEDILEQLKAACRSEMERELIPVIEIQRSMREDFMHGLIQMALMKVLT